MRAFEVLVNSERVCVAGIGDHGVANVMLDHVVGSQRNELHLRVGGLISTTQEHVLWANKNLEIGDEVVVKILETDTADPPKERFRIDAHRDLEAQKRYVREMAKSFGWRLDTGSEVG